MTVPVYGVADHLPRSRPLRLTRRLRVLLLRRLALPVAGVGLLVLLGGLSWLGVKDGPLDPTALPVLALGTRMLWVTRHRLPGGWKRWAW